MIGKEAKSLTAISYFTLKIDEMSVSIDESKTKSCMLLTLSLLLLQRFIQHAL